ncbi:hypothetical protein M422DRAFT_166226 [Sphaerobolus stellatus SS14]|uniref:BZIP domain-containing protein n=1 Tax=Sphaerobolus stellatus (strain SS14) TaxID=990650 RepID=A0A0C9W202_SPHS4|nr:hypothetical protein M422DRAFT_166226 [Sphaerobolus stellatus SS14]
MEDKRQRNTAASARFRIKKKQKTLELERTVSDLTSRAAELEREATNLRRENSWLKEIVILKGRQNIASSQMAAQETSSHPERKPSRNGRDVTEEESSEDSSSEEEDTKGKGKGKGRGKGKERASSRK